MTAGEAITALQGSRDVEVVFYLYVIDARRHLVGVVSLRRLLLVSPATPLKRIMTTDIISVRVDMDQEEVARLVASYNLLAIPVVDEENKLVGVITVDDVIDVIKDEATEDVYRLAGLTGDDRVFSRPSESLRKRLPWLIVNLATAFLAASVVALFQNTISIVTALAVFMPVVAGMGGNAATQTLTVIVRGIALGELTWTNSRKALLKETLVGLGNGLACGLVGALVVYLVKGDGWLGTILAMAMVINMFVAATAGTLIPLALRALKVDPALASSVFITTLTDVFGFLSFLGLGTLFIKTCTLQGRMSGYRAAETGVIRLRAPRAERFGVPRRPSLGNRRTLEPGDLGTGALRALEPGTLEPQTDACLHVGGADPSHVQARGSRPHRRLPDAGPREEARRGQRSPAAAVALYGRARAYDASRSGLLRARATGSGSDQLRGTAEVSLVRHVGDVLGGARARRVFRGVD